MSGHSKWSTIKRKKAKTDAQRGKVFTKVIKEITVAARTGGGDESTNPALRQAIANAKAVNMPSANVEKAIKKGTGELPGVVYEEVTYEGYGPGGTAILLDALTDNKNRTVAEIRHILSKHNGNLGEAGCVAWIFDKKGLIAVKADKISEDDLMEVALEAGADDMRLEDDMYEIVTQPAAFEEVKKSLAEQQIETESVELTMFPKNTVKVNEKEAIQLLKLMDFLEDHDDVNNVYSNFDVAPDVLEKIGNAD
ncbi:YebC/PmpR family DNA-binding transcriptional regulator [candidate division KSB1 bacterium]|nr:YebC/PmpR family DNA-binding transcriptional regulator [candidate division KSB1 bacterium]MBL7092977.1 YebC/PmpR family DNA-binding transcriptional regulator [candidate division KSB1 bacterium]